MTNARGLRILSTVVPGSGQFQLSNLMGYIYGCVLGFGLGLGLELGLVGS